MNATNGLEAEVLAQTAFNAFHASAKLQSDWELCMSKTDWLNVADHAIALMDSRSDNDEINLNVREAADSLRRSFESANEKPVLFGKLKKGQQLAWEAVARHLFNCITAEADSINLAECEQHWGPWTERKLQGARK